MKSKRDENECKCSSTISLTRKEEKERKKEENTEGERRRRRKGNGGSEKKMWVSSVRLLEDDVSKK